MFPEITPYFYKRCISINNIRYDENEVILHLDCKRIKHGKRVHVICLYSVGVIGG